MTFVQVSALTSEQYFQKAIREFVTSHQTPVILMDSAQQFYYYSRRHRKWKMDSKLRKIRTVVFNDIINFLKKTAARVSSQAREFILQIIKEYKIDPIKLIVRILVPVLEGLMPTLAIAF